MRLVSLLVVLLTVALSATTLPLKEVRDWYGAPLLSGTVAVFGPGGEVIAVARVINGKVEGELPWEPGYVLRVAWGHLTIDDIKHGVDMWIYDSSNVRDIAELGNPVFTKIRTYVYTVAVTVRDPDNNPLAGCHIHLVDAVTGGRLYSGAGETGVDGVALIVPQPGAPPQVPLGHFRLEVYCGDIFVAERTFTLARGTSISAWGYDVVIVVNFVDFLRIVDGVYGEGHLTLRGVKLVNGSIGDVTVRFRAGGGILALERGVPFLNCSAELYFARLTVRGFHLSERRLSGTLPELVALLNSSEWISVAIIDRSGALREEWHIEVLLGNATVASGNGRVDAALPPSALVGKYVARIISPNGIMKEIPLNASRGRAEVLLRIATVTIQAVDGFGEVRHDWEVEIADTVRGKGEVVVELLEGDTYEARVRAPGFFNSTKFAASDAVVRLEVPTGKLLARIVDGFGAVRSDWIIEIKGVARGGGEVGPAEVLAGRYLASAVVFGREFSKIVDVPVGEVVVVTLNVPTARLEIGVVDEDGNPLDNITSLEIFGPINLTLNAPGIVELIAGTYTVRATVFGKSVSAEVTLMEGQVIKFNIVIPRTREIGFSLVVAGAVLTFAIALYVFTSRRRRD